MLRELELLISVYSLSTTYQKEKKRKSYNDLQNNTWSELIKNTKQYLQ